MKKSTAECYNDMIVSEKLIEFVHIHEKEDVNVLRLKYAGKKETELNFDVKFALLQIEARRKAMQKIPGFLSYADFIIPSLLSAEQASNETVARFHADLISPSASLLDLTAGLGIDDMSFAMRGVNVTACEIDDIKCAALRHNAEVLGVSGKLSVVNADSIIYLRQQNEIFDVVFADPARRNSAGGRVHALSDCHPDILASMSDILSVAPRLLIKSSPLLDLSLICNTVKYLNNIYVVCFKGECKEVLIDIRKDSSFEGITVVDLDREREISRFHTDFFHIDSHPKVTPCERKKVSDYQYLYEPNAGVMKTGAWSTITNKYSELSKADPNTHIFLSDVYYDDFPGRVMQIYSEPDKKALKAIKGTKFNSVVRNYPLTATEFSKKYGIVSGGEDYLYAFRYAGKPVIVLAKPIRQGLL